MMSAGQARPSTEEELLEALYEQAPSDDDRLDIRQVGAVHDGDPRYFVFSDVLDELAYAAAFRDEHSFAILRGSFALDESGPFIEVGGFSRLEYLPELGNLYHRVKPSLDAEFRDADTEEAARQIVGLFVSARGSQGHLDPEVIRAHLSLFNMTYQLVGMYDPDSHQFGLYARPPQSRFVNMGFHLVDHRSD